MSNLFVWKEQLKNLYAKYSRYIDKVLQFALALAVFALINSNIGFMKGAANPLVTLVLAVICTFPPLTVIIVAAAVLLLLHMFSVSMGVAGLMAALFLIMFIFYIRFTPKQAIVILLTPIAFLLKIPVIIPIVFGLVGTPIYAVPVVFGTVVYYVADYVKSNVTVITGADGIVKQVMAFAQGAFQNKTMWVTAAAFVICLFAVYSLRRMSMNNSWKVAIIVGAVVNMVIIVVGDIAIDVSVAYVNLIAGSAVAVLIAFVLEFFIFSVDYTRTEHMQFEDDEYYYYVKAVPKISVSAPEKTVKKINERQETTVIDSKDIKREGYESNRMQERRSNDRKKEPEIHDRYGDGSKFGGFDDPISRTDEILLAQSLKEELEIHDIVQKELNGEK